MLSNDVADYTIHCQTAVQSGGNKLTSLKRRVIDYASRLFGQQHNEYDVKSIYGE